MASKIIYEEHNQVLNSLEGISKAAAPGFFYSKVLSRMEKKNTSETAMPGSFRPVYAFVLLIIFLMVNITVLLKENRPGKQGTPKIESFADAYHLNSSSLYE